MVKFAIIQYLIFLQNRINFFHTQTMPILCVEAGIVDQVYTTTNDITSCKCWTIGLSSSRGTK